MTTFYGYTPLPASNPAARSLLFVLFVFCLALLPELLLAAEQQRNTEQPAAEEPQAPDAATALDTTPPASHASQQAPDALLIMAVHQPENLIGKTLILDDGANVVTVGPVLDVRRRVQDQEIYLIVDAKAYFNTAVEYAVALRDVDRMEADKLVIPEAPGMHLKGLDYYPADYTDLADTIPPAPPSEDD